jgi:hypothetical protein
MARVASFSRSAANASRKFVDPNRPRRHAAAVEIQSHRRERALRNRAERKAGALIMTFAEIQTLCAAAGKRYQDAAAELRSATIDLGATDRDVTEFVDAATFAFADRLVEILES